MLNYNRNQPLTTATTTTTPPSTTNTTGYIPLNNQNTSPQKRITTWLTTLSTKQKLILTSIIIYIFWWLFFSSSNNKSPTLNNNNNPSQINIATWNIGAINNNPFEYWLTMDDDPNYESILTKVESFVQNPTTKKDVEVSFIFTQQMYDTLRQEMVKLKWDGLDIVDRLWTSDWSKRHIISQFLKDPQIGLKRLVSMPDRMTNTITTSSTTLTYFRPTTTNCYSEKMGSISDWYSKWITFMFHTSLLHLNNKTPAQLLERIPRAKYPALTEEEERISIPLQTLLLAIFDSIQVRMLNQLAGGETWQTLRNRICSELNTKKTTNTLNIILKSYSDVHVFMLQETAASFVQEAKNALSKVFHVIVPNKLGKNDQNSLILLSKEYFPSISLVKELSIQVTPSDMVSQGDLFVIEVSDRWSRKYTFASFHGDTNGLATIPVVKAVSEQTNWPLIFGLDANTYFKKDVGKIQDVEGFMSFFSSIHLTSVWGTLHVPPHTTKNARTYMQPQLSKAASRSEVEEKGDQNPKDFILFQPNKFEMVKEQQQQQQPIRDNTGKKEFDEDLVFPTLTFPSDHAVLSAKLQLL